METRLGPVLGGLLMVGLIAGGYVLGAQIKEVKLADRYVTVRGLTERTVQSDLAEWNLSFKDVGDDLPTVYAKSVTDKKAVLDFLAAQGVTPAEVTVNPARVTDRRSNEYNADEKGPRYIVAQSIAVESKNVAGIAAAEQKSSALLEQGVVLANTGGESGARFLFTGLNAIKPDMISEATRNARAAADRFAADSGSKVGSIRRAEQGIFSISAASGDSVAGENGEMGQNGAASVAKKVRVVTTVDYYLER